MPIQLTVRPDEEQPTDYVYEFDLREVLIGREGRCHVQLPFPFVSSHHLTIIAEGNGYFVVDNGATNETTLNDQLMPPHSFTPISSGDRIDISRISIKVEIRSDITRGFSMEDSSEHARNMVLMTLDTRGSDPGVVIEAVDGPAKGARAVIPEETRRFSVGRSDRCDMIVNDPLCSDQHFVIRRHGASFSIKPLGENICHVNGQLISNERDLEHETRIAIGQTQLRFIDPLRRYLDHLSPENEDPTPRSTPHQRAPRRPTERVDDQLSDLERKKLLATLPLPTFGPPDRPPVLQKPQLDHSGEHSNPLSLSELHTEDASSWGLFEYVSISIAVLLFIGGLLVALILMNVI